MVKIIKVKTPVSGTGEQASCKVKNYSQILFFIGTICLINKYYNYE
jgi:hypothetical protein